MVLGHLGWQFVVLLLNYQYLPGSDLFLVYNQAWDTEGGWQQANRSLQFKLAYFWKR